MTRFPDPHQSRAVLIGTSTYHGEGDLPEIPAVRANLSDLEDALVGASTGTLDRHSCAVVAEPTSVADVGRVITAACVEATDLLLMYYAGHGLVDERGRLHLALSPTDPTQLRWTALPFETLREEIATSPASTRVLVLDCCFSGRAIDTMTAAQSMTTGQIDITGTYTLTSTTANALSYAPQGDKHTAFTGALLTQLNTPATLTLDELFRRTDHSLAIQGAPRPQRRVVNAAGDLALFKAPAPPQDPPSAADTAQRKIALTRLAGAMRAKLEQAAVFDGDFHCGISEGASFAIWGAGSVLASTMGENITNNNPSSLAFYFLSIVLFAFALWSLFYNARLVLSAEGVIFRRYRILDRSINSSQPIPWTCFDQIGLFGEGKGAELVVWHKKESLHRLPGTEDHSGTKVCVGKDIGVVNSYQSDRLRSALKWFAGDTYVEQSYNSPAPHHL